MRRSLRLVSNTLRTITWTPSVRRDCVELVRLAAQLSAADRQALLYLAERAVRVARPASSGGSAGSLRT